MNTSLDALATPAIVVDLDRMDANIARVAAYARTHGLALRPHVKTHKAPYVAALQVAAGSAGVTCATPREAEAMRSATPDLLVAYPPVDRHRAARIAALARDAQVTVMLDSAVAIDMLAAAIDPFRSDIRVLVELDVGMGRLGVRDGTEAVALAERILATRGLEYVGVGFYPGHIRIPIDTQGPALADVNARLQEILVALHRAGVPPAVVSGGSTPTLWRSHEVEGLTEIRPGTSVYNDRTTASIGACTADECALTVLATVVSTAVPGRAVIDAGLKALGREPIRGGAGEGHGALLEVPGAIVTTLSEEHGTIELEGTGWAPRVGDRVRVVPNHVCIVTHLFDEAHGLRGDMIERSWPISARGR